MHTRILLIILQFAYASAFAQQTEVYPTHWWTGMKWNKVQILIRAADVLSSEKINIKYPGITINKTYRFDNAKYLAVDISISAAAKPGTPVIELTSNGKKQLISWPLKSRRKGNGIEYAQGVASSDFIYLLMPDRFSNGDPSNDQVPGMKDQSLNRDSIFLRHGGDLQGVINHLDYLQDLGITTLWMTPVIENDMPNRTEHGYAFTNHYRIDPRLGGEKAYKNLSDSLHKRGMKLIQDAVYNHMGLYHFLMQDAPSNDWVHQWPEFTKPNYKDQVHFDPYVSAKDKKQMVDGWFTQEMPDLNQSNPFVANFLIQHAIWSVEEFGVDAWRIDTYIYVDDAFMNRCNQALLNEYPKMTMFGESWVEGPANQAFFTKNIFSMPFKSNLPGTLDFQTSLHGIHPALKEPGTGVNQLYQTLGRDFVYQNPMNNVIFLDNHDMSRIFSVVGEDVQKQKTGIKWLLTERGIPQLYYGTEILMKGISNPDGWVRLDFPGGWQGDKKNAFTKEGLSTEEIAVHELTRKLADCRKNSPALKNGKMMHYVPDNGLYVYFRYNSNETIMCIMNASKENRIIHFNNYPERTRGFSKAIDVLADNSININESPEIPAGDMWILQMKK
jgi:glycosidase